MSILESETAVNAFKGHVADSDVIKYLIRNLPWELILHTGKLVSGAMMSIRDESGRECICTEYFVPSRTTVVYAAILDDVEQ